MAIDYSKITAAEQKRQRAQAVIDLAREIYLNHKADTFEEAIEEAEHVLDVMSKYMEEKTQ